jgi:hypothetical protein
LIAKLQRPNLSVEILKNNNKIFKMKEKNMKNIQSDHNGDPEDEIPLSFK